MNLTNIHDEDDMSRFMFYEVTSIFAPSTAAPDTCNGQFISDQSPALCHHPLDWWTAGGMEITWRREEGVF